jgi:N-acyl-L-homoserine lactone synthetase
MIHIITAENRHCFNHALMAMHRQRKAVFIDELRWSLEAPDGLEIDSYDCPEAVYLLETDGAKAPLTASARLLPTTRPHLMADIFSDLCAEGPPRAAEIWEVTRFCPAPETPQGRPRHSALARMIAGIMETALIFGIEKVSFVASAGLAPLAMKVGWTIRPLGPPQGQGREQLRAFLAEIDAKGLREVRLRNNLIGPLTRYAPADFARAA